MTTSFIPRPLRFALVALAGPVALLAQYDILIRGGRVLDGSASPWRHADIAITGDRIMEVGFIPTTATAKRVINAAGKYVTPGFIDAHSHVAPEIGTEKGAPAIPMLLQGVTTAMINPDGGGPADLKPQLDAIRTQRPGLNIVPMIGHNGVRSTVMGMENRAPTPGELQQMKDYVRGAMQLGAFGFSSGPFYTPGKFSTTDELVALARVANETPGAFHISHVRDEASYDVGVVEAVNELIEVSRQTGIIGVATHIKCIGPTVWGKSADIIANINKARAEGLSIWSDQYAYAASSTGLQAALVPGWAQEGGPTALRTRLANPEQRATIRLEMVDNLARRAGANAVMIASHAADRKLEGKRLDEIARERLQDPVDTAIDILMAGGASIVSFNMNETDLEAFMKQPWNMTCSDGGLPEFGVGAGHPRSYGAFSRKIRRYVVERGAISLEHAIHTSTGLTAGVFGIKDRGVLVRGAYADILVFDLATVTDLATYEQPHAYSTGMDFILINGQVAVADGKVTPERHGRVLLRHQQ